MEIHVCVRKDIFKITLDNALFVILLVFSVTGVTQLIVWDAQSMMEEFNRGINVYVWYRRGFSREPGEIVLHALLHVLLVLMKH